MRKENITTRIASIETVSGDSETAHALIDMLMNDFIKFVARRNDSIGEMARLVLSVNEIEVNWKAFS
jgi:hypothetical protein